MDNEIEQIINVVNGGDTTQDTPPAAIEEESEAVAVEASEGQETDTTEAVVEETPNKIDYSVEIPLVNGEKMSVGKLKDYYQANQKASADFIEKENAVLRQLDEVNRMAQYLDVVPEHIKQQAAQEMQQNIKEEFHRMLDVIPVWKDAVEFNKGKESIYSLAREYNLEKDISQVSDHRVIKMLYDFARLKEGVKQASAIKAPKQGTSTGGKPKAPLSSTEKQQALINKAKTSRNSSDELAAINSLFQ